MKHIYGERCSGKTMACLELCKRKNAFLLTSNVEKDRLIAGSEKGYKDVAQRVISWKEYQELVKKPWFRQHRIVIDEAGALLSEIFGKALIGYSETIRDLPEENYIFLDTLMGEEAKEELYDGREIIFKPYDEWEI